MPQRNTSRKSFLKGIGAACAACAGALLWVSPAKAARMEAAAPSQPAWPVVRKSPCAVAHNSLKSDHGGSH